MKTIFRQLESYWFSPMPAQRLALLRIASGGFVLWYFITRYKLLSGIGHSDTDSFAPVGLAAWLSAPLPPDVFMGIVWLTLALGTAYLLGWKFRFTGIGFALASLFVFSYRYSWSMIYHDNIAVVLHVLIIALSPAADAYALDAPSRNNAGQETVHWRYSWPIRLLCTATALTYFVSGVAKVTGELAWGWMDGSAMRSQVAVDALRKELLGESASALFYWLYAHGELFLLMGLFTLVVELGAPLALWSKRTRAVWALATWGMHWGILLLMGISFRYQLSGLIFLSFFEIEKILPGLRSKWVLWHPRSANTTIAAPDIVLFDGICNFCNAWVRFIAVRDPRGVFRFASQQSATGQSLLSAHNTPADLSSIVLIESGRVYRNSTAVLRIARRMGGLWLLVYGFVAVPAPIRDAIYRWFARNRYVWFGQADTCTIPDREMRRRFLDEPT
jgi:predicted DCC family thiol-disulfide oxidoreductase YuxK